jgi:2-methylcitrate dehydratase PrpD
VLGLAGRVEHRRDPDSGYPRFYSGEVVVQTTDGRELRRRELVNRGAPERPIQSDDVVAKFRANLEFAGIGADRTERLVDAVLTLEDHEDASGFTASLSGR